MAKRAAFRSHVPSRRAKRPSALLDDDPPRPCSSSSTAETNLPTWGTKHAHTAPRDLVRARGQRRDTDDWASLPDGPAWLISERVLANDVADYVHFRAVCHAWRRCSADPRGHCALRDRRFHPRWWLMLREEEDAHAAAATPHRRRFLNASTGQCVQVDIPELRDHHCAVEPTAEGLLVLVDARTLAVRVLNPFTRQVAELPSLATLLPRNRFKKCLFSRKGFKTCYARDLAAGDLSVDGAGLAGEGRVALYFSGLRMLAVARAGDERWTVAYRENWFTIMSVLSFAGRFYCFVHGKVMVVETAENQPPQLLVAAKHTGAQWGDTLCLVESGRELMLVHRSLPRCDHGYRRKYEVFQIGLDARKTMPVRGLDGNAMFIGALRALSVCSKVFPSISADTIYPGFEYEGRAIGDKIEAYHLTDGSTDVSSGFRLARPYRIIDILSLYIRGYRDKYDEQKSSHMLRQL